MDRFLSIEVNPEPVVLSCVTSLAEIQKWRVFSDASFGGSSRGALELRTDEEGPETSSNRRVSILMEMTHACTCTPARTHTHTHTHMHTL